MFSRFVFNLKKVPPVGDTVPNPIYFFIYIIHVVDYI